MVVDKPRGDRAQQRVPAGRDALLTIMTPVFPDNATLALLHNQVCERQGIRTGLWKQLQF